MRRCTAIVVAAAAIVAGGACSDDDPSTAGSTGSETSVSTSGGTGPLDPVATPETTPPSTAVATSAPPTTAPGDAAPRPSAGCGTSAVTSLEWARREMRVRGIDRWYLLTVPSAHDGSTPLPIVLDFHGFSEGAEVHTMMSEMAPAAERRGFVAVIPQGTEEPVRWNVEPDVAANDDLAYVAELLDRMERQLCIDTSRVYATGLSNGASMSSSITCALTDRFAAVAPVAGANMLCDTRDRPMPVFSIHGTADPILLFNGGVDTSNIPGIEGDDSVPPTIPEPDLTGPGYPQTMVEWAARNGCDATFTDEPFADDVIKRVWDCPDGADVEFVIVVGGGHSWPGSKFSAQVEAVIGPTTDSFDATDSMWDFFDRFTVPAG